MCFTSTSAFSDEFCAGSSPFSLIELLGHQLFRGCHPGTAVCVREAESRLCLLHAKDNGAGSPEQGWEVPINHSERLSQDSSSVGPGMLGGCPLAPGPMGKGQCHVGGFAKPGNRKRFKFCSLGVYARNSKSAWPLGYLGSWCVVE